MADRYRASPVSVRLSQEDQQWLAKLAHDTNVTAHSLVKQAVQYFRYWQEEGQETLKEALEIFEAERSRLEYERRRRHNIQREMQLQSRRLHAMLRDERNRRWKQQIQLRNERIRRIKYENQLRDERTRWAKSEMQLPSKRDDDGRQARAATAYRDAPYDPKVAKLLALAICSESDGEATAAFAKARALHRQEQYSMSDIR